MCFYRDQPRDPLSMADIGQALGGLGIIAGIVLAVVMFTAAVRDRPSIEAQQIIQAGRTLAEQVGR